MKRRNFIKLSSTLSFASLLPTEVFSMFNALGLTDCPDISNRKLVLIQLAGANDGLNTLVPLNQYDTYANLRPTIKLKNTGANAVLNIDSTLPFEKQVGLHPIMTGFKHLYDSGFLRIIQGVGYPMQNKSHFQSTDNWLTGGDGTLPNSNIQSGWMGRFIENYYSESINSNFPLAIELGSNTNSLGFQGIHEHDLSLNIYGQDNTNFYTIINGLAGAVPTSIPDSDYGNLIQFILDNDVTTNNYAQSVTNAYNSGTASNAYPTSSFGQQMKTVAKLISGGIDTKIFLVKLEGFDNHYSQVASTANSHIGNHAKLLKQLSDAVHSFITDLNNQNKGDDVIALTFSEFGRKAAENASLGTDHGEIAPMFVFGKNVLPGISGVNPNLSEAVATNNFQIQTVQHDYRRVFSSILTHWLGSSNQTLDLTFYDNTNNTGFGSQLLSPFIKPEAIVLPDCYGNESSRRINEKWGAEAMIYPNPANLFVTIKLNNNQEIKRLEIYSQNGSLIYSVNSKSHQSSFNVDVSNFANGSYIVKIQTAYQLFSDKLIVIK